VIYMRDMAAVLSHRSVITDGVLVQLTCLFGGSITGVFGNRNTWELMTRISGGNEGVLYRVNLFTLRGSKLGMKLGFCVRGMVLTLSLLMYIYGAPCKARISNVGYIWTYV
jgi:hypothetical protein